MSDRLKNILAAVAVVSIAAVATSRTLTYSDAPPLPHRQVVASAPPTLVLTSLVR